MFTILGLSLATVLLLLVIAAIVGYMASGDGLDFFIGYQALQGVGELLGIVFVALLEAIASASK